MTVMTCYITTLSPIHIGCDEVYEPTSFVVDEKDAKLIAFDTATFLEDLPADKLSRFSEICKKGTVSSILEIYHFMRDERGSVTGTEVEVCSGFLNHYSNTLKLRGSGEQRILQELNHFTIARTAFLPSTGRAYIPGSAVKGAMRTAYLNQLASNKTVSTSPPSEKGKELEKRLLDGGGFDTDPFRMLKISDFLPVGQVDTRIIYAINQKKKDSEFLTSAIPQILEVIEPGAKFFGTVTVNEGQIDQRIKNPLDLSKVWNSMGFFYVSKEKRREDSELQKIGILNATDSLLSGSTLLRVGRHSGAESVTIDGYRQIKIIKPKGGKATFESKSTTVWLASESRKISSKAALKPFGWVALTELDPQKDKEFQEIESKWRRNKEDQQAQMLERAQLELSRLAEERRLAEMVAEQRRLEEERKQKEEAERQRALASMTVEQKMAAELGKPNIQENRIYEIFQKIDELDNKKVVAQALKDCWIRMDKWSEKRCTAKQKSKVKKVKEILGED